MDRNLGDIVPAGHIFIRGNVLEKGSLTGVSANRAAWAKGLNLPLKAEYTFFAGCGYQHMKFVEGMMGALKNAEKFGLGVSKVMGMGKIFGKIGIDLTSITAKITASKEDPYTGILSKAVRVLQELGVDVGYLHEEEPCCGSPLYYTGFEDEYAEHAQKNYRILKSFGVKKIIGLVPACTSALRNIYPKYIDKYDLEVEHFLEVVARRLGETGKKLKLKEKRVVTYHEPCQLSRYLGLIKQPREIMKEIEGLELVEPDPDHRGEWSTCCGGGGLEVCFPELSERLGTRRVDDLLKTGATIIATSCPACVLQMSKAVEKLQVNVKVVDLVEILNEALE
jgi:heterodisulfide reductase subunit B